MLSSAETGAWGAWGRAAPITGPEARFRRALSAQGRLCAPSRAGTAARGGRRFHADHRPLNPPALPACTPQLLAGWVGAWGAKGHVWAPTQATDEISRHRVDPAPPATLPMHPPWKPRWSMPGLVPHLGALSTRAGATSTAAVHVCQLGSFPTLASPNRRSALFYTAPAAQLVSGGDPYSTGAAARRARSVEQC